MSTPPSPTPSPSLPLLLGPLLSAFTSGTLASLSLITIPALLSASPTQHILLTSWHATLNHGVRIAPPLAIASTLVHLSNAYTSHNPNATALLVTAAASTLGIVPFTLLVLQGTNEALFALERCAGDAAVQKETRELVRKWARVNLGRSVLPLVGAVVAGFAAG